MSRNGLDVFDKTIQTTNVWLDEIMEHMGPDRQLAWRVLGAVMQTLRDRLPVDDAAHLSAQLPLLVRGLYYDQWHPGSGIRKDIRKDRRQEDFLQHITERLSGLRPVNARDATRAVFSVLQRHVTGGQVEKIASSLPQELRALWPPAGEDPAATSKITAAQQDEAEPVSALDEPVSTGV